MEFVEPVMKGILLLPPQGVLGQLKKTWHKKYCLLFKSSKNGIERVEIYDNHKEAMLQIHSPRIITLEACIKISPSNQPYVFTVFTKSGSYHFGCSNEVDMNIWISAFQSVAFKDDSSTQTIEEDNELYSSSCEGIFSVRLVETDASIRCGLTPKSYTLVVAPMDIRLMSDHGVICSWPYQYIKRYGYKDGKFTLLAGRKCQSGEGSFYFEHGNRQEIFRCVSSKMESIKRQLIVENIQNIECNDAQYHAALSMEAGSRSPLPPSPNISSRLDVDITTIPQTNQKHSTNSSSSSLESLSLPKTAPTVVKPTPAKPPRKSLFQNLADKPAHKPESTDSPMINDKNKTSIHRNSVEIPIGSAKINPIEEEDNTNPYDLVEFKNNVTKSRVTECVEKFSSLIQKAERTHESDRQIRYESVRPVVDIAKPPRNVAENMTTVSPIIHNVSNKTSNSQDYDKLQHFGSTHKLNHNSTYKTSTSTPVSPVDSPNIYENVPSITHTESNQAKSNTTWYNYDLVEDMSAVRLANDNHGYGMIKKKLSPQTSTGVSGPKQTIYNNAEYAIISKPKRV